MRKYKHQYGTVEHMMLYGALGDANLYYDQRYGLEAWYNNIPGMKEEFPNYRQDPLGTTKDAMSIASTNLKVLGQGVDAWLANFAKEKAQILRAQGKKVAIIQETSNAEYAKKLYAELRRLDKEEHDVLIVQRAAADYLGIAINDRLTRAAYGANLSSNNSPHTSSHKGNKS